MLVLERRVARVLVERVAPLPAVGDDRADLALREDERLGGGRLVAGLVRLRVGAHDLLQPRQGLDGLRGVEGALPLAALELGDLSAVVVDERHRGEPVLAGEVERRVAAVLAVLRLQLLQRAFELVEALRRLLDAGGLVLVGPVDDAARARVVRDAVELALVGRRVRQALQPGGRVRDAPLRRT